MKITIEKVENGYVLLDVRFPYASYASGKRLIGNFKELVKLLKSYFKEGEKKMIDPKDMPFINYDPYEPPDEPEEDMTGFPD